MNPSADAAWHKFDTGLQSLYADYLFLQSGHGAVRNVHPALTADPERVHFTLEYSGDLAVLEAEGFEPTQRTREGLANGSVRLAGLAAFSNHPQVRTMRYGMPMKSRLDTSVESMLARGSGKAWNVNPATGVFTGTTGKNVVIGIIDTGIDWKHSAFMIANTNKTRILGIWDMGLVPQAGEQSANSFYTASGLSYGVHYTRQQIDAALAGTAGAIPIRHRDCDGHGTHVAGIAAGNGQQEFTSGKPKFEYCGVAPEAWLVIVKHLDLVKQPPAAATEAIRFKDAITFILNLAAGEPNPNSALPGLPVVINCSFGLDLGPCDGLNINGSDGDHSFLMDTFALAQGKICVFAAGNEAGDRKHAAITIPAGGSVEVPLEVFDGRTFKKSFTGCAIQPNTGTLFTEIYYVNTPGAEVAFKPPGQPSFSRKIPLSGQPILNNFYDGLKTFSLFHAFTTAPIGPAFTLQRNNITLLINPDGSVFKTGNEYRLLITGPPGTVFQMWCSGGSGFGVRLPAAVPPEVEVNDRHTLVTPGDCLAVISVAAYENPPPNTNLPSVLAHFSSQGPLTSFSGQGPGANKPDVAAPGVVIHSANSSHTAPPKSLAKLVESVSDQLGKTYVPLSGTSMAAPHITGVVALMLQKNPLLIKSTIMDCFQKAVRPGLKTKAGTDVTAPEVVGVGMIDVTAALNAIPKQP